MAWNLVKVSLGGYLTHFVFTRYLIGIEVGNALNILSWISRELRLYEYIFPEWYI